MWIVKVINAKAKKTEQGNKRDVSDYTDDFYSRPGRLRYGLTHRRISLRLLTSMMILEVRRMIYGLLGSLFTTGGFKTGEVASRERGEEKSGKRRTRRAKDPDAPKRPKSAFMIWQWDGEHGVAKVKQENPILLIRRL